jgi:hypothetical protein
MKHIWKRIGDLYILVSQVRYVSVPLWKPWRDYQR